MRISIRGRMLLVSAFVFAGTALWSQQSQKPLQPPTVSADLAVTFAAEPSQVVSSQNFWFKGGGADAALTFWKGVGLAATLTGDHAGNVMSGVDVNKISYLGGPRYTFTAWQATTGPSRLQVFGQGLVGGAHGFDGIYPDGTGVKSSANSLAVQAGGGLNNYFSKHWGARLLEADYVRTELPNTADDVQNDFCLAAGITYHLQAAPPPPVTLSSSASPSAVFPGELVTVTATASNLNPKEHVVYSFAGAGATANGTTGTVDTHLLAPGTYMVKTQVKEGKPGKEGLKPWQSAESSASFTVKQFEPPTISVSVNPSTIKPGDTAMVTATGVSPQSRPLTYSYAVTAGAISGTGTTVSFSSVGAPTGPVGITSTVTDDKGQVATASTTVTITAPYVAPAPRTQALRAISFARDKKRPARVDNEAKVSLDEVALELQKQPDAKAVIVGNSNAKERAKLAKEEKGTARRKHLKIVDLAAERAVNTKACLVTEKGIYASRISLATGTADEQTVNIYLVPSGATFTADVTGTTPVDEAAVKAQPCKPLAKHHHAAAKKASS